jgi:hypothetical protein
MRWVVLTFITIALAVAGLSIPTATVTTKAYASKMNGKPFGAEARTSRSACFNGACKKKK